MRLGLIIYGSLDTLSGGYLYDHQLVTHLRRQGDHVEIISLPWRSYARHLMDNLSPTLLDRLQQLSLDILLQDELNHPSLFWLNRRLRERVSYPFVSIVHHLRSSEARPAWQNRFYRLVERRYLSDVDGFIFNSLTTRQAVMDCLENQTSLVPSVIAYPAGDRLEHQINAQAIVERANTPGALRLIFLGNVIPRKGLHTLLGALSRLPDLQNAGSWTLKVIGSLEVDPSYASRIRRFVDRHGIGEQVQFMGVLDDHTLAEQLSSSHVLVVPSSYEGFGIVYLEGMSFGLPAIATSNGAAGEIITSGKDGFIIPAGDESSLAYHLQELIHNRQRLQSMSLAARQRYEAHPGWVTSMSRARAFLHYLVKPTRLRLEAEFVA
jgi:glycosyltransferase involved in cell wall biosynthesis